MGSEDRPDPDGGAAAEAVGLRARVVSHLRRRAEWYWAPALYALAVAILYRPIWSGHVGFGWDTIESYWGDLSYFTHQLGRGHFPGWNPFDRGGYPFVGDPQSAVYYPVQWLFAGAGVVLGGTSWWLIQLKMLAHHAIAGLTLHGYLRSRRTTRLAAVVGGLAWIVCAPMEMHKASNLIHPIVWVPLVWIAIDHLVERPSWRSAAALAAALYLPGTAGSPPGFFYALLLTLPYGVYRAVAKAIAERRLDRAQLVAWARRFGIALAVAAGVVVAMLLIVVVPAMRLTDHSLRAHRSLGYALQGGLAVGRGLVGLVQPDRGDGQVYMGIAVLTVGLGGLALAPLRDRGLRIYLLGAALLYLALAFGGHFPLLAALVRHAPGFGLFRIANRYKLDMAVVLAALAGLGADALLAQEAPRSRARYVALAAALAVGVLVVVVLLTNDLPARLRVRALPGSRSVMIAAAAAALVATALFLRRRAGVAALVVLAGLIYWEVPHFRGVYGPSMEKRWSSANAEALRGLDGIDSRWRVFDEYVVEQRAGSRLGFREVRSYPSGDPLDLRVYRDLRKFVTKRPEILADFNVRYVLHGPHHRNGLGNNDIKLPPDRIAPGAFRRLDARRFEVVDPAPLVAWYGAVRVEPDHGRVLADVADARDGQGPRRYAVVEPRDAAGVPAAIERWRIGGPPGAETRAGTLVDYQPDRIEVKIDAPAAGLVVLNEIAYPGWEVEVDGRDAAPLTADYLLRAAVVPAGTHTLVWTYAPPHYRLLAVLWLLGCGVLVAAGVSAWRRRRQRPASAPA